VKLDAGTFLLQWATGGLAFLWVTTRRREVSLGYGWLIRSTFGLMALAGCALLFVNDHPSAAVPAALCVVATATALAVSVVDRKAGVSGREAIRAERRARVAAMTGQAVDLPYRQGHEFPPAFDIAAPVLGFAGLLAASEFAGGPIALAAARLVVGAFFLGVVSDAMLLGHWYLVQPGLRRDPVNELVFWSIVLWPFEVVVFLIPTGMVQVINGTVDDGYSGLLGWIWLACCVATISLVLLTRAALKERYYSAVMAATGLLYLAILTAFGMDLLPRAVLS
jgi:hypothetical protein